MKLPVPRFFILEPIGTVRHSIQMKATLLLMFLLLVGTISYSQVHVKGYYRKDGTYVKPHERTYPNSTVTDNYSYPGNYNPNTGTITGGSTYTRSKIDDYGIGSGDVDWGAIGRAGTPERKTYSSNPPPTFKNDLPKYIPLAKRNYLKNNKGKILGYTYTSGEMLIYQTFFVYDVKGTFMFFIIKYEDGIMYSYAPNGKFIGLVNGI